MKKPLQIGNKLTIGKDSENLTYEVVGRTKYEIWIEVTPDESMNYEGYDHTMVLMEDDYHYPPNEVDYSYRPVLLDDRSKWTRGKWLDISLI
jgi:hypothetical protein